MAQTMTYLSTRTAMTLAGERFGRWTVGAACIEQNGRRKWACRCTCGTERLVDERNLLAGKSMSCGCYSREKAKGRINDLTGRQFGRLTVLERAANQRGRTAWHCVCTCGNRCVAVGHDLMQGKTKSCGCLRAEKTTAQDLAGQVFGRLRAIAPTEKRDKKGSVIWTCVCGCGTETEVTQDMLTGGRTVSCGCRKQEVQANLKHTRHLVDGTCLELLGEKKRRSDNTTGHTGISMRANGKFRATIGFKGRPYSLGTYDTLTEAVKAREKAEEELFKPFLEAFYEQAR